MMTKKPGRLSAIALTIATAATFGISGCSAVTVKAAPQSPSAAATTSAAKDMLPSKVKDAGVLRFATDDTIPPFVFKEGGTLSGATYELMEAIAKQLGLKLEEQATKFGSLITTLQADRADVSGGDFTDTAVRQQTVDFVDYESTSHKVLVPVANPKNINSIEDLCGMTAGSSTGGLDAKLENDQSAKCVQDGKPAVNVLLFDSPSSAVVALQAGRLDAIAEEAAPGAYAAKTTGTLKQVGGPLLISNHGFAFDKSNSELSKAVYTAVQELISNGTYKKIYEKWNLSETALDAPLFNGKPLS